MNESDKTLILAEYSVVREFVKKARHELRFVPADEEGVKETKKHLERACAGVGLAQMAVPDQIIPLLTDASKHLAQFRIGFEHISARHPELKHRHSVAGLAHDAQESIVRVVRAIENKGESVWEEQRKTTSP